MSKQDAVKKRVAAAAAAASGSDSTSSIRPSSTVTTTLKELYSAINTTIADYTDSLTPRLKLIDSFLVFLVALGVLQFIYVLIVGNFPFNAFLAGFISCVGQFVLTVSLRLQINEKNKHKHSIKKVDEDEEEEPKVSRVFKFISPERAFGDYIFASLILHYIVIHFIN
ncbi:Dolichyl-diphosphooligosaccharide--protein glycosyltransferase subunit DAD1 [Spathaspora sp. JA1]|nr:Dolichyl-diphosphooligosaccharide--protein glycosyltransferase subunit DAD1 [Spathaspora sp. JA1]